MAISSGIQVIQGYYPNNLRGFNAGITKGKDLQSMPLKGIQVA
jgi:hypothetical protein